MVIPDFQQAQPLAQFFTQSMLNSVAEGLAITLFGWMMLRLLGRQSSTTRFAVWFSALVAVAALPFFDGFSSNHEVSVARVTSAFHLSGAWAIGIFAVWAVVATTGLIKVGVSFWSVRKLRKSCRRVDPESLDPILQNTLKEFGSARGVTLCTSRRVKVPAAIGFIRPAIILPPWSLEELHADELNAVLLHELAHLRRWDDWTNLTQQVLRALFFFHPAVWWIGHGLATEREMACDDFVLAGTSDRQAYARCLLSVAEKTFLHRGLALALAVAGRVHQTSRRVVRILDADRPAGTTVWKPALGLVATFSLVCLMALPHAPRLVDFESERPSLSAALAKPSFAYDSSAAKARMIPASLHIATPAPPVREHDLRSANAPGKLKAEVTHPQAALVRQANEGLVSLRPPSPRLVSARERSTGENAQPRSVLLVMQAQQVDDSGRVVWSFAVWRFTLFHPTTPEVRKEIAPKST